MLFESAQEKTIVWRGAYVQVPSRVHMMVQEHALPRLAASDPLLGAREGGSWLLGLLTKSLQLRISQYTTKVLKINYVIINISVT
jgi:hypothetical protein